MNKDEILDKSRKENKNQDPYAKDIFQKGVNISIVVSAILATLFYVIQILVRLGENYCLYAIVFSIPATGYLVTAIRLKNRRDITAAIVYIIVTIFFSIIHINHLITSSTIL